MARKPRVVMGWEMGAGLNHVVSLARIAAALNLRGMDVVGAHLCLTDNAAVLAPHVKGAVRLAPSFSHPSRGTAQHIAESVSFGDFLGHVGYASEAALAQQIGLWRRIFAEDRPDFVVVDYAPTAMLAARALGLPTIATAPPFCLPPSHIPEFPLLALNGGKRIFAEATLLANVNNALAPYGCKALTALPQVHEADLTAIGSLRMVDYYNGARVLPLLPPLNPSAPPASQPGDAVVVYLSTPGPITDPIWEALAMLDMPVLVIAPQLASAILRKLDRSNITISTSILTAADFVARARSVVNTGNHGSVCMALRAALPQVCLPLHGEQASNCIKIGASGAAIVLEPAQQRAPDIANAIRQAYDSQSMRARAIALAGQVAPVFLSDGIAMLADQIGAVLEMGTGLKLEPEPQRPPIGKSSSKAVAGTTRLRCYRLTPNAPDLRPARSERDWMNTTNQRYAYRCVPLSIANSSGWELSLPLGFEATWDGGPSKEAITLKSLTGGPADAQIVTTHFGHGVLTLHTGYLIRTDPGWGILCRGAPNEAKDGIAALDGLVETDWLPFPFTMNWRFTRPCTVRFEKGEVFCFLMPVAHLALEGIEPEILHLADDLELQAEYDAWSKSRATFLTKLEAGDSATVKEAWQRYYLRGATATGQAAPDSHRAKRRLAQGRSSKVQK